MQSQFPLGLQLQSFFLPLLAFQFRAREFSILKHSLVVLLDFWFSCAHTTSDTLRQMLLETVDGRRSTADCRLRTVVIVFCAGVAVDWHCIEKCYVEFLCILHRLCGDEGRLLSSTKQKRSKLVARAFVQNFVHARGVASEGNCNDFFPYDTKNIPINMHATAINNYARDQNRTSPSSSPSSFSSSYSYCFGWSSDCNWNDNQDVYDDDRVD